MGLMELPWSVLFLLAYIAEQLRGGYRVQKVRPHAIDLGPLFRADAKAEGQEVSIGGLECIGGAIPRKQYGLGFQLAGRAPHGLSAEESRSGRLPPLSSLQRWSR